jgi:serine/threonine protein kinase/Tol biopolymer transport system component
VDPERWEQVADLLHEAHALPEEQREAFLDERCGDDRALRVEVESLLAAAADSDGFFEDLGARVIPGGDGTQEEAEPLTEGQEVGAFVVKERIGHGGMGTVYRATDTRLLRDVALKVLPPHLADDAHHEARFKREARLLAALSHPGIASIYGIEEVGSQKILVLELVDGPTLNDRIPPDGLPVSEALELGLEMAEALEAAHRAGIVHRDFKPANVKLTREDDVKVLDFGIAKGIGFRDETSSDRSPSATAILAATSVGQVVGTIAYMSPEQLKGRPVDARVDVWAFGAVLFEMLAGRRAFQGEYPAETLARILERPPEWDALPDDLPAPLLELLRRCLCKNVNRRLQAIGEARIVLEDLLDPSTGASPQTTTSSAGDERPWVLPVLTGVAALAVAVAAYSWTRSTPQEALPHAHFALETAPGTYLYGGHPDDARIGSLRPSRRSLTVSPDGRTLVFAATDGDTSRLYARPLGQPAASPISGTEGGSGPFFSPDGAWVGFYAEGEMKRVPLGGGEARTVLSDAPDGQDAYWSDLGFIVYSDGEEGLFRVSETGGPPQRITRVDRLAGEDRHVLPQVLPGGGPLLYTVRRDPRRWDDAEIVLAEIDGSNPRVLIEDGSDARYAGSGHIVFARSGTLMASEFDPRRGEAAGEPRRLADDVMHALGGVNDNINNGAAQYALSETGALFYVTGGIHPEVRRDLLWVSREGEATSLPVPAGFHLYPRYSEARGELAYARVQRSGDREIWIRDLESGSSRRFPREGFNNDPVWSPDGRRLAYGSDEGGAVINIYAMASDGRSPPVRITDSPSDQFPSDWSGTGLLAFVQDGDIWVVGMEGDAPGEPRLVIGGASNEAWPTFSPDGDWLAYASDRSGGWDVYVRSMSEGSAEYLVSTDGGTRPAWSRDGTELFYRTGRNNRSRMVALEVRTGPEFRYGRPVELFDGPFSGASPVRDYDVTPDGRFVMTRQLQPVDRPARRIEVVLNWLAELEPSDGD